MIQAARVRQLAQPAAGQVIEDDRADDMDQGADPLLARGDDHAAQRVRFPAQPGQDLLRQVSALVVDLPEAPRPGRHARHRDSEHERQQVAAAPALPQVLDLRQYLQQAGNVSGGVLIGAGHGGSAGMRH